MVLQLQLIISLLVLKELSPSDKRQLLSVSSSNPVLCASVDLALVYLAKSICVYVELVQHLRAIFFKVVND